MATTTRPGNMTDALTTRVHHHSWYSYRLAILAGEPAPTLCGIVKSATQLAASLPCCPMCSDVLAGDGKKCNPGGSM